MKPPPWGSRMGSYERRRGAMPLEQRDPLTRRDDKETPVRHRAEATAATKLSFIAKRAREEHELKFSTLMHHFSKENLEHCFHEQDGKKAVGVDGVKKEDYVKELDQNLSMLVDKLKRFSYRPAPVRRVMIPKGDGKERPLGTVTIRAVPLGSATSKTSWCSPWQPRCWRRSMSKIFWNAHTDFGQPEDVIGQSRAPTNS